MQKVIACEVMKNELLSFEPSFPTAFEFISMGLHSNPHKLNLELQNSLNQSEGFERIILGFGLCGGSTKDLTSKSTELIIPKTHDCVPILLGDNVYYQNILHEEKGTFFLSHGWMIGEKDILTEHLRIIKKFGEKKALRVLEQMYQNYKRVLFIHGHSTCNDGCFQQANEIANLLNLAFEETTGRKEYLESIINGPWDNDKFIRIPPGTPITEELFGI